MINFATAKKRLSLGGSPYEIKHRITRMKTLKKMANRTLKRSQMSDYCELVSAWLVCFCSAVETVCIRKKITRKKI